MTHFFELRTRSLTKNTKVKVVSIFIFSVNTLIISQVKLAS